MRSVYLIDDLGDACPGSTVTLTGAEARHASVVCRLAPGAELDVVDGRGRRVTGHVTEIAAEAVLVRVDDVVDEPEPQPVLVVVQALVKGDRAERAVETLTEVGVDQIVPWAAQRCVVSWDARRAERGKARWLSTAREAAKQSRRARTPRIADLATTREVAALVSTAALAVVLDAEAERPLVSVPVPARGTIVLIVGPEGGVSEGELASLADAGAITARLGPTVLRAATAGTVAAAVVLARTTAWGDPVAGSAP